MSYRHLIIGLGNIGLRHARTLIELGESIDIIDTNPTRIPSNLKYNNYCVLLDSVKWEDIKSILICTPPNTHLDILDRVLNYNIPVFIEKPILTGEESENLYNSILERSRGLKNTFVTCNYRFCKDYWLGDIRFVEYGYLYKNKWSYLDLIHMVDLCWERYGKPLYGNLICRDSIFNLSMAFNNNKFVNIQANNQSPIKYGRLNGIAVDTSYMFMNQMKYWLEVVRGRTESINLIEKAVERTKWLIGLKES